MPRKPKQKPKPKPQRRSLVPMPPPMVIAARGKKNNRKNGLSAKAKAEIQELTEALKKKKTSIAHVAAGVGGAVSCTLIGSLIVSKGWMSAKWAALLLTSIGAGATFAAWRQGSQTLLWTGAGWTSAGAAHTTMALVVDARRAAEAKRRAATDTSKPRNALDNERDTDIDAARRLRLSQDRTRELEAELARARRSMHPESELAAA